MRRPSTEGDAVEPALLPTIDQLTGVVVLRSALAHRIPPPSYILCEGNTPLPVITLTLERSKDREVTPPTRAASTSGEPEWRRCHLLLWGLWADRLSEVTRGSVLTVTGAEIEPSLATSSSSESWQLALPPRGAKEHACVTISQQPGSIEGSRILVTASGIKHILSNTSPGVPMGNKRPRPNLPSVYEYVSVRQMGDPFFRDTCAGKAAGSDHVFGVVIEYQLPRPTRKQDMRSVLHLADESSEANDQHLVVTFFKTHPHVPCIGSVIRLHRLKRSSPYAGVPQAMGSTATQWVIGDGANKDANRSSKSIHWTRDDSTRVARLQDWARKRLSSGPFSKFHDPSLTLAAARAHALALSPDAASPTDVTVDLVVQLAPFPESAPLASAAPQRYGAGSTAHDAILLPIASFRDLGCGTTAESLSTVPMFVVHNLSPHSAKLLLWHLRSTPNEIAFAGQCSLDPNIIRFTDPLPSSIGSTASGQRANSKQDSTCQNFDTRRVDRGSVCGLWVRLRSVRLTWHLVTGMCIVYTETSTAMHLPDHHAEVTKLTLSQHQPIDPSSATQVAACHDIASSGAASERTSTFSPSNAPDGINPSVIEACRQAAHRGDHPGACNECTVAHQSHYVEANASNFMDKFGRPSYLGPSAYRSEAAKPIVQYCRSDGASTYLCHTTVLHTRLPLLSVVQAQDICPTVLPRAFRLRARIVRALPSDPVRWTTTKAGDAEGSLISGPQYRYQLVLQLSDELVPSACIGAILEGTEGDRFFSGLKACDLHVSNVSLGVLQNRVRSLCASPPLDFGIVAYLPEPEARWSLESQRRAIAYRIVGTEMHAYSAAAA